MRRLLIVLGVFCAAGVVVGVAWQIPGERSLFGEEREKYRHLAAFENLPLPRKVVVASGKEVLQGVEDVYVLVESIEPEVEEYGLRTEDIRRDTELQLRQYGIKVLSREEWRSTPKQRVLYIWVSVLMAEEIHMSAVGMLCRFSENVLLLGEPTTLCKGACTWMRYDVGLYGLGSIKKVREGVKKVVNEFINDYLAANSKEKATDTKKKRR